MPVDATIPFLIEGEGNGFCTEPASGMLNMESQRKAMPRIAYLDYNATTPLDSRVLQAMLPCLQEEWGNPSSVHDWGQSARYAVEKARAQVADLVGVSDEHLIFTGTGSESICQVLHSVAKKWRGQSCHILTSAIEHPATLRSLEQLHQDGMIQYSTVLPEHSGWIDPKRVESMIRSDTRLISIMSANNETGIIQPLPEIADLARSRVIAIHSDMVQSLGKINLRFDDLQLDFASFAAHKIYGPKGIGALAFREKGDLIPLLHGGGQEMGLRAGTENTAGIVGFGAAAALCREFLPEEATRITRLRDQFEEQLKKKIDGLHILGADQTRLPGTSCICFEALLGTYLVQDLAAEGIAISSGSACRVGESKPSHILLAMGIDPELARGAVRFSLGRFTTEDEILQAAELTRRAVLQLRQNPEKI